MLRYILRQRRRLAFAGFFMALAITVGATQLGIAKGFGDGYYGMLFIVTAAIIIGLGTALVLLVALPILPDWRHLGELIAVMLFIEMSLAIPFPDYFGAYAPSALSGVLWFAVFVIVYSLTYGTWLDRFPMWLGWNSKRSVVLPQTAAELWPMLMPGFGTVEQHWDRLLADCEPIPDEENSFDLQYAHGHGLFTHVTIHYLEVEPNMRAKYYFQGEVDEANKSLSEGTYEVVLEDQEKGGCKVTIKETRSALLPRFGLNLWFDDYLGDYTDHLRAAMTGKRDWSLAGRYRRKAVSLS